MEHGRIVLAGGSGFLGRALATDLSAHGYAVTVLTRTPHTTSASGVQQVFWDGRTLGPWAQTLDGALAVINLAGKNVNCRATAPNRREILYSRLDSVHVVGQAISRCKEPPRTWLQASSLAIYGDTGPRICDENAPPGVGFPVETCLLWEQALRAQQVPQTRKVALRIGFVLGHDGGALPTLTALTRAFLGGAVGSGQQYISWLHIADWNRVVRWLLDHSEVDGVVNITGPEPVTNAELMRALRRTLGRPWSPPVPVWAAHIGAWAMRTEADLALQGRRCVPRRLQEHGFMFNYPQLEPALCDVLR
jgi:uncharacterized protein